MTRGYGNLFRAFHTVCHSLTYSLMRSTIRSRTRKISFVESLALAGGHFAILGRRASGIQRVVSCFQAALEVGNRRDLV